MTSHNDLERRSFRCFCKRTIILEPAEAIEGKTLTITCPHCSERVSYKTVAGWVLRWSPPHVAGQRWRGRGRSGGAGEGESLARPRRHRLTPEELGIPVEE